MNEYLDSTPLLAYCSKDFKKRDAGVPRMVKGLSEGYGPSLADTVQYSTFYKKLIKQMEYFLVDVIEVPGEAPKKVTGRVVAASLFEKLKTRWSEDKKSALPQALRLRAFSWLLLTAERKEVDTMVSRSATSKAASYLKILMDKGRACEDSSER